MLLQEQRAHFSHSQLTTMLQCPYKYYLTYIEHRGWDFLPSPVSFGSAIHEALAGFHRGLQNGGSNGCIDVFKSSFTQSAGKTVFKHDNEFDELMLKGEELIAQYTESFQNLKPAEVELDFRLPLVNTYTGDLLESDIVGKIDLIADDSIYELKTGSSSLPKSAVDENLQLILYGWAYRMLYGVAPQKLILVNLVKTKQPKIQVLDTIIDAQKEKKLMDLMFRVNEAIGKECFYPNPKGTYGCSGCSYSLSCEYAF